MIFFANILKNFFLSLLFLSVLNSDVFASHNYNSSQYNNRTSNWYNYSQNNSYSNNSYDNSSNSYVSWLNNWSHYSGNSIGLFTGINSSRLELTADYETGNKRLNFRAELKNLNQSNQNLRSNWYYRAEFTIDRETYYTHFRYNQGIQSLVAVHSESLLSSSSLDSSYYVTLRVFENGRLILEETDSIRPSTNFYRTLNHINSNQNQNINQYQNTNSHINTNYSNSNWNSWTLPQNSTQNSTTSTSAFTRSNNPISEGEVLAFRYIFKIEAQIHDTTTRIQTLNKIVNILESIRYTHQEPLVIDSMIITIKNRIISYH